MGQPLTLPPPKAVVDWEGEGVTLPLMLPPPPASPSSPAAQPLLLPPLPLIAQGVCVPEPPDGEEEKVVGGEGVVDTELEGHTVGEGVEQGVVEREGDRVEVGESVPQEVAVVLVQ